ncbi:MAG: hypothetical protein NDI82_03310 [Anaeromyxobacteraceae bacterium]|nr:hypothetical protein [Anaeromyxobacteraceae bacterium]
MARSSFQQVEFRCVLCGARFTALAGAQPQVATPVCMDCGLRHSTEKLRQLIAAALEKQGNR